jgi:5'-nucleotidase
MGVALGATSLAVLAAAPAQAAPVQIQILATNDFHGRLINESTVSSGTSPAGAAVLSGAVKQLRTGNPNTAFVAAGDLIGASTFESFIQQDVPTIEALNEAGLDVSAVGNHELDQGFDDLDGRVQDLADWEYIVANLRLKSDNTHPLAPTWTQEFGGVTVGYVGAVTEDLPALVSPAGIADLNVTDIVTEVNAAAADLRTGGADLVVMLVHEGAPSTNCATMDDAGTTWGDIVNGVSPDIDAIVSGHTHLAYNCSFPVQQWVDGGRAVTDRPVVSAGQYGTNLNQLVYTVDDATGAVTAKTQAILPLEGPDPDGSGPGVPPSLYPADPVVESIVADAVAEAEELGAVPLGSIDAPFDRAVRFAPDGDDADTLPDVVENRGGESTLGNLVAEVQRWATSPEEFGGAQIAFMNPGGLRADMRGDGSGGTVSYRQAAAVQPFANTLVNMELTGAQIKTVLEQQWQRDSMGNIPSRPFLRLGTSAGFEYSYDPTLPEGDRITGIWLDGEPIGEATAYSVTVNSFLASGGDNFREFANGANKRDTGQIDLQAMVDYMEEFASDAPLPVDYSQHSIGVTPLGTGQLHLSSLMMSGSDDVLDTHVAVEADGESLGSFPLDCTLGMVPFDEYGTTTVHLPTGDRPEMLTVTGNKSGTDMEVAVPQLPAIPRPVDRSASDPSSCEAPLAASTLDVVVKPQRVVVDRTRARVIATVTTPDGAATGRIEVKVGNKTYKAKLENGRAVVQLKPFGSTGKKKVKVSYLGNASTESASETVTIRVRRR